MPSSMEKGGPLRAHCIHISRGNSKILRNALTGIGSGLVALGIALGAASANAQAGASAEKNTPKTPAVAKPASTAKPAQSAKPTASAAARPAKPAQNAKVSRSASNPKKNVARAPAQGVRASKVKAEPGYNSMGSRLGLRSELADLSLNSSAVMVLDQASGEVLLEKNADAALPIASITKVMTAMVVLDAAQPLDESIVIAREDTQLEKYSASRLKVGASFTRAELLHLALMSSENRAANALGRSYPGGLPAFVIAMNDKARALGMTSSTFVEPTGLSSGNVASPRDLAVLVNAAHHVPLIRDYSTDRDAVVRVGGRQQQFKNTNALTRDETWDIGLSKTGFIRDAGKCLVMQARLDQREVIIVMLDAEGSAKRLADAERIRRWLSIERDRQASAVRS
jgi:serine-type D-Ala-D-Ala endopeptidase (penicillin-binding protein 7)